MLQLAHPKVAQPKPEAFQPQVCHGALTVQHKCQTIRWIVSENTPLTIVCNVLKRNEIYPLLFTGRVYNTPFLNLLCAESISLPFRVNVNSLSIPSFHLTLSFLSQDLSEKWAHQMCQKELPLPQHLLQYHFLHLNAYFWLDSSAFCVPFSFLWLNISSYRFFWWSVTTSQYFFSRLIHSVKKKFSPTT